MTKSTDCFFIGHNEMNFVEYEKSVREMGINSGAYRDLNKNFIRYNDIPYHLSQVYNIFNSKESGEYVEPKPLNVGDTFNLAVAYLGSYVHARKLTFDYVNTFQDEKEVLAEKLAQENILTIAIITTLYVSIFPVLEIVEFIRKYNKTAKIIIGGPFISNQVRTLQQAELEYLFKSIGADFYVNSSQGEASLVKIIYALKNNVSPASIDNIYYRDGDRILQTSLAREDNPLEENMVNWDLFADRAGEHVNARTSISCPFSCSFCGFPEHAGKYRVAGLQAVEKELNRLNRIESVESVQFIDDTFNVPKERFKEILRMMIRNKYKFRWHSHYRCQFADRETVELMKESGCEGVFLGIESGSNKILKIMNKAATVEKYLAGVQLLKEYDILTYGSFIIGFPGETDETVAETLNFIENSGIDFFRTQLWYCDTMTPIWKEREKYGIKGSHFEWSHDTMNADRAAAITDEIFLSIEEPIWVPQYNFEFDGLFHLLHRGMSLEQLKRFIQAFNRGIREKITQPNQRDVGFEVIEELERSLGNSDSHLEACPEPQESVNQYEAGFDF